MAILLAINSCKKGVFETRVEGKVTNSKTGEAVVSQRVYLLLVKGGCLFGCNYTLDEIASAVTDSKGNYEIIFKAKNQFKLNTKGRYQVQGTANNESDSKFYRSPILGEITETKTTKVDIVLDPKAKIIIRFKNLRPIDIYNGVKYELMENGKKGFSQFHEFANFGSEITLNIRDGIEAMNTIQYKFTRHGIEETKDTSVFIGSYETKSININF